MKEQFKTSLEYFGLALFQNLLKLLLVVIIASILLWVMGSFIAWDTDYSQWFVLKYRYGRTLVAIIECFFIYKVYKMTNLETMFPRETKSFPQITDNHSSFNQINSTF